MKYIGPIYLKKIFLCVFTMIFLRKSALMEKKNKILLKYVKYFKNRHKLAY